MTATGLAGWPEGRPRALGFLLRFLFTDAEQVWRYVVLAWPVVAIPTFALGWLASRLAPGLAGPDLDGGPAWFAFVGVVLVSPLLETLVMSVPVALLDRWRGPVAAAVGSAVLWGVLHSLVAARWGLVVWWPFLVFSIAYLTWRPRGYWPAIGIVTAIHVVHNAVPMLALLVLH